jgi:hypothetical protein
MMPLEMMKGIIWYPNVTTVIDKFRAVLSDYLTWWSFALNQKKLEDRFYKFLANCFFDNNVIWNKLSTYLTA